MGRRNYWHVYNYMRRKLIDNGKQPERPELLNEFIDLDPDEVDEGIAEFEVAYGRRNEAVSHG
ncbi:hypothetical protein [Paenibacillus agri]|uniref:Uncharacterized protein n=1 Tax=Paenibacillus agri TaxID=2744309 RepID=A0A850ESH2_9BACL|nr:hypothetical protein [Paenibacillus agri]NUU62669.1 hypothetical protein [Paenibacillus agri]